MNKKYVIFSHYADLSSPFIARLVGRRKNANCFTTSDDWLKKRIYFINKERMENEREAFEIAKVLNESIK